MGDTRAQILRSALRLFSRHGLDQTSLRAIARDAQVDPALVLHYFGSKEGILLDYYVSKMHETMERWAREVALPENMGEEVVARFLTLIEESGGTQIFAALFRTAVTNDRFLKLFRSRVVGLIASRLREADVDHADERAALSMGQMVGLGVGRYVFRVEPIVSMTPEELGRLIGPTLTRYLKDDLWKQESARRSPS